MDQGKGPQRGRLYSPRLGGIGRDNKQYNLLILSMKEIKTLFSEKQIEERIAVLGREITESYRGKEITLIGVIKGALPFFIRLSPHIKLKQKWDFMALSSYGDGMKSSGIVKVNMDLAESISGQNILIIEDIIDSGATMEYLLKYLQNRRPASIKICTLLLKKESLKKGINIDYVGFSIPNKFVVGFGLDLAQRHRELPYIGYIEQ
jgi:hypoxanthine phosphoribosyltransferase